MSGPGVSLALVAIFGAAASGLAGQTEADRLTYESEHMGTTFRIVAYAHDRTQADRAARAAFAHIARLDSLFSDYRPDSEIAGLADHAGSGSFVPVTPELLSVLQDAQHWARRTEGAFDVTVGPLSRLWRWSSRRGELPNDERVAAARSVVGFRRLALNATELEARLTERGMSLDLGGIAKGYAADAALAIMAEHGIGAALVDAGGDLALGDPPPDERGWLVALPNGNSLRLAHAGVATSGDAHRHVTIDGVRYAHIVDPRTGLGVVDAPTVTVVAPDATTADALASALTVMDRASGMKLTRSVDGAWATVTGSASWMTGQQPERASQQNRR